MKNEDLKMGIYGTFKVSEWRRVDSKVETRNCTHKFEVVA